MKEEKDYTSIVHNVVDKFKSNQELYKVVAELLEKHILPELFPDAQKVSARSKEPDSIAGKVLKKYIQLDNADEIYNKFTDLVGARVIFLRRDQVDAADARIRTFFTVDDHNSQNTAERLNDREFGYQSRHYIVCIDQKWMKDKLVANQDGTNATRCNVRPEGEKLIGQIIQKLNSPIFIELQVRTWLQHVWADLSHDSVYKGDRVIPRELMRSWNALAAILENVDEDIVRCLDQLEQYRKNSAYNIAEEVDRKIETMKIIAWVQLEPHHHDSLTEKERHHLARSYDELLRLQKITQGNNNDLQKLIEKIEKAIEVSSPPKQDLTNPEELLAFLSEQTNFDEPMLAPLLNMALERCERMILSNSELPWAFAGKAFFNMLLFKEEESNQEKNERVWKIYDSVLRLIDLCNERSVANLDWERRIATPDSRKALTQLKNIISPDLGLRDIPCQDGQAPVWKCVQKMLELGCYAHGLESLVPNNEENGPAVIIAGGCNSLNETTTLADFKRLFSAALDGNTPIHFYTGADENGICSLDFGKKNNVTRFGCSNDKNANIKSKYAKHSVWEALLTWDSLKDKKCRFDDVALVGFGLSEISGWECRIALAFGARVTVIGHKDFLSYKQTFEGIPYWSNHPSLVRLPLIRNKKPKNASFIADKERRLLMFRSYDFPEPIMLRTFMIFKPFHEADYRSKDEHDTILKLIQQIKELKTKKSLTDWDNLSSRNRCSTRHRLLSFLDLFRDAHGENNPPGTVICPPDIPDQERIRDWLLNVRIENLNVDYDFGEREHARWYIERWLQGTRYDINKIDKGVPNVQMKNPCMVAWFDLDDDTIVKDTDFISRYLVARHIKDNRADAVKAISQAFIAQQKR